MIGKLSGRLDWRGGDTVLIDVRGVGYVVHVSDRTMAGLPGMGEAVSLYTELLVREDLLQLFGFPTMLEKEWHKLLMTVQGVGAKASMAILGTLGPEGVGRAITLGDQRAIQAAPGVGPKLAQRIILELKSKAGSVMAMAQAGSLLYAPDVYMDKIAIGPGYAKGVVDLDAVVDAGQFISNHLGRKAASRAGNAIATRRAQAAASAA